MLTRRSFIISALGIGASLVLAGCSSPTNTQPADNSSSASTNTSNTQPSSQPKAAANDLWWRTGDAKQGYNLKGIDGSKLFENNLDSRYCIIGAPAEGSILVAWITGTYDSTFKTYNNQKAHVGIMDIATQKVTKEITDTVSKILCVDESGNIKSLAIYEGHPAGAAWCIGGSTSSSSSSEFLTYALDAKGNIKLIIHGRLGLARVDSINDSSDTLIYSGAKTLYRDYFKAVVEDENTGKKTTNWYDYSGNLICTSSGDSGLASALPEGATLSNAYLTESFCEDGTLIAQVKKNSKTAYGIWDIKNQKWLVELQADYEIDWYYKGVIIINTPSNGQPVSLSSSPFNFAKAENGALSIVGSLNLSQGKEERVATGIYRHEAYDGTCYFSNNALNENNKMIEVGKPSTVSTPGSANEIIGSTITGYQFDKSSVSGFMES